MSFRWDFWILELVKLVLGEGERAEGGHMEHEGRTIYQQGKGKRRIRGKRRRFPSLSKPIEFADNTYFQSQIFNKLSHPPVTNRRLAPGSGLLLTKLPGAAAGAQLTELTPVPCAKNI